jgi:hypothetical protein
VYIFTDPFQIWFIDTRTHVLAAAMVVMEEISISALTPSFRSRRRYSGSSERRIVWSERVVDSS